MLTRLRVQGFKNLRDCEVVFGPLTCVAGANGVGKSNLLDAIVFLRDLADFSIIEAASRVRDPAGAKQGDIRSLFTQRPDGQIAEMSFTAEMLVGKSVQDDFGRTGTPTATHLKYDVAFRYATTVGATGERLELIRERLTYIPKGESSKQLGFPHSADFWRSVIGEGRRADYISTEDRNGQVIIKLRQEGGQGRPQEIPAATSPRTVLGTLNTDDRPTALAARREMQSWTLLQLEPSQLRQPDEFQTEPKLSQTGAHLPATLERLGTYSEVANSLAELVDDITSVEVDVDAGRRLKTLVVTDRGGMRYPARALSDGTLRFLALAILGTDNLSPSVVCLEEPENGIHPSRIPAMLRLLEGIAVDPRRPVEAGNALRQVIINTHSPIVVQSLRKEDLLVAYKVKQSRASYCVFGAVENTWRTNLNDGPRMSSVPLGTLLAYLTEPPSESTPGEERLGDAEGNPSARETVGGYLKSQLELELNAAT